jgi:hypothetical protein
MQWMLLYREIDNDSALKGEWQYKSWEVSDIQTVPAVQNFTSQVMEIASHDVYNTTFIWIPNQLWL